MKKIRTKREISQSIIKGLEEALAFSKGKKTAKRSRDIIISELPMYKGNQVKKIRRKIDVTQKIFAEVLGVSVKTVEAWEGNRNIPDGPAQRLIYAIDNNPKFLKTIGIKV
jgi:putative transcriptional regulator